MTETKKDVAQSSAAGAAFVLKLSRPIEGHQGKIERLSFRAATFGDYLQCGDIMTTVVTNPESEDKQMQVDFDAEAVMRWTSRLTSIDALVLEQLAMRDVLAIKTHLQKEMGDTGN